jgi:hypothetical protein
MDAFTTLPWAAQFEPVIKLQIRRRGEGSDDISAPGAKVLPERRAQRFLMLEPKTRTPGNHEGLRGGQLAGSTGLEGVFRG